MPKPCAQCAAGTLLLRARAASANWSSSSHKSCFGEYLNHIAGGIPMNGQEQIRLHELGIDPMSASALFEGHDR
jgi:hypothetical protein